MTVPARLSRTDERIATAVCQRAGIPAYIYERNCLVPNVFDYGLMLKGVLAVARGATPRIVIEVYGPRPY